MPGARRGTQRQQLSCTPCCNLSKGKESQNTTITGDEPETLSFMMSSLIVQPRHAHLPDIPTDGNLLFEFMYYSYAVACLGLQFVNLYKTVWWLPHSHSNMALNFYLIDTHLCILLLSIMSRRLVWCFVTEVCNIKSRKGCQYWFMCIVSFMVLSASATIFGYSAYNVIMKHSLLYCLFLCYPLITYAFVFGKRFHALVLSIPLLRSSKRLGRLLETVGSEKTSSPSSSSLTTSSVRSSSKVVPNTSSSGDFPQHVCSMSPEAVRDEVETLRVDFNSRVTNVLYDSMLCAYYMGFVPLCFAQNLQDNCESCWNTLYYDTWWVGQHVLVVWMGAFVILMVYYLNPKYIDILHKCALHLGRWVRIEGRQASLPCMAWSELQVWQQGVVVKHVKGLFHAEGVNNSAEPGNSMHARFYFMFSSALRVTNWLLLLTWALIIYQFTQLVQATEWSHILGLAFFLFCNYYVVFKLMRDRFVMLKVYKEEQGGTKDSSSDH